MERPPVLRSLGNLADAGPFSTDHQRHPEFSFMSRAGNTSNGAIRHFTIGYGPYTVSPSIPYRQAVGQWAIDLPLRRWIRSSMAATYSYRGIDAQEPFELRFNQLPFGRSSHVPNRDRVISRRKRNLVCGY